MPFSRRIESREYAHDRLGERFRHALSDYDTRRRVETLIDDFLPDSAVRGKSALDVGCGLGFLSERLKARGALVTACDLGPSLVAHTAAYVGCPAVVADALRLTETSPPNSFDVVVSSECIEHTPDPDGAIREMAAVLKPGGLLAVSTPNVLWRPTVRLADWLRVRPFQAYENFSSWSRLRRSLRAAQIDVLREAGIHLIPFQLRLEGLSRWLDSRAQWARPLMINLCILGRKGSPRCRRSLVRP
ncbi:MAG: methyltransferase domain-containing protein [Planctomycetota bacterium]